MTIKVVDNNDIREVRKFNVFCRYIKHTLNDAYMFSPRSEAIVVIAKQRNFKIYLKMDNMDIDDDAKN